MHRHRMTALEIIIDAAVDDRHGDAAHRHHDQGHQHAQRGMQPAHRELALHGIHVEAGHGDDQRHEGPPEALLAMAWVAPQARRHHHGQHPHEADMEDARQRQQALRPPAAQPEGQAPQQPQPQQPAHMARLEGRRVGELRHGRQRKAGNSRQRGPHQQLVHVPDHGTARHPGQWPASRQEQQPQPQQPHAEQHGGHEEGSKAALPQRVGQLPGPGSQGRGSGRHGFHRRRHDSLIRKMDRNAGAQHPARRPVVAGATAEPASIRA